MGKIFPTLFCGEGQIIKLTRTHIQISLNRIYSSLFHVKISMRKASPCLIFETWIVFLLCLSLCKYTFAYISFIQCIFIYYFLIISFRNPLITFMIYVTYMLFSPLIIYISYSNPFSLFFLFQLFQIMPPVGTSLIIQSSPIILTVLRTNAYHTTNDHLCAHRKINGYEPRLFIRLVIKFYLDKSNWI